MVDAVTQVVEETEGEFMARDLVEPVSLLCNHNINKTIIGKILSRMEERGSVVKIRKVKNMGYLYRRGVGFDYKDK